MFLKSLEIYGFKSFADRTLINFAEGVTALLGPNGCGKSNVVDSIKWVLAENKSKNLRADSMEGVIFDGTEKRPALSMAEVTLTIANENGLLPIEDTEIAIKRRLYRNGENQYFINNRQVNATTVRKLFMDTGVGKAAYSVMEQGKIDQVLSSKPEDRRYLFEEAAGISRSKAEVAEAERELEKTKANLTQIEIGLSETKRSYETLKVQADKTSKYRKLKEDKFNYELDIQLLKLKDFTQNKARNEQNRIEIEKKRDTLAKEIDDIYATLNENTDKVKELQNLVLQKQQEQIKIATSQNGKKESAKILHNQQYELKNKISQIEYKIKNSAEKISDLNDDIDNQNAQVHEMNKQLEDIRKNIANFIGNINQSKIQIDDNTRTISTDAGKIHNLNNERSELQKKLTEITEDIVTELDAKLKSAGYSSSANKKAKEDLNNQLDKIKIFVKGRTNIFSDFAKLPSPSQKDSVNFANDAVKAFSDLQNMFDELGIAIDSYTKTSPQFIDDFLSPEGIITQKREIDRSIADNLLQISQIQEESDRLAKINLELNKKINDYRETLDNLRGNESLKNQQISSCNHEISNLKRQIVEIENAKREQESELEGETLKLDNLEEKIQEIDEEIAELQQKGESLSKELDNLDFQIEECNKKVSGKENILNKKKEERNKYASQLERYAIDIAQTETEIRNVKNNFTENYSRDLMEFEERMYTITASSQSLKEKLAETKQKISDLGQLNLMAVEEFAEEKERYEKQQASYDDTKKTLENLVRVSEEIKTKSSEMFINTYNQIRRNFHNMFRRLFNGGRAELKLSDPANVLTSGIDIYAQPPGKKLEAISLLSGGEKTMTAVALLFATYQVRPSPFCLLDEIDAALDDRNVSSFVTTLKTFANVSQYIVITHNKKTVAAASSLIGVSMEESGITKVIQLRLDHDTLNGNLSYEEDNFVEEDVPPEEGIVIPPRPPRRAHNPDGSLKIDEEAKTEDNESDLENLENSAL